MDPMSDPISPARTINATVSPMVQRALKIEAARLGLRIPETLERIIRASCPEAVAEAEKELKK
jgi:hypothetical protein